MTVTKFPSTPTPIAAALQAAFVGVAFATGADGVAQSAHAGAGSGEESNKRSFRIPSGPLGPALSRFATRAGARLSFDPALTEGKTTRGLSGDFTREEGLASLLAGTGLEWAPGPGGAYTVRPTVRAQATPEAPVPPGEQPAELDTITLDPITVTAQPLDQGFKADTQETATKTPMSIRETPQAVSVITRDSTEARQVIGLGQALETAAGTVQSQEAGPFAGRQIFGTARYSIRGVRTPLFFNVYEDGFYTPVTAGTPDLALYERVEVLKGPSSTLYGRAGAAGLINLVRKKPLPEFQAGVDASAGFFDFYRTEGDVTGPLFSSDEARGRLVLAYENTGSFVDFAESERVVAAPSLEFDLTDSTRLLLLGQYQQENFILHGGLPLQRDGEDFKAPDVRRSLFLGVPNRDKDDSERELLSGTLQLDQEIGDRWLATVRLNGGSPSSTHDANNYAFGALTPAGDVGLYSGFIENDQDIWSGEIRFNGRLNVLDRPANLTMGVDHNDTAYGFEFGYVSLGTANIYDENFDFPTVQPTNLSAFATDFESTGVYGQVQFRPFDRLSILLGGRHDWTDTSQESFFGSFSEDFKSADEFTGRASLTFYLTKQISAYGLYAQSFDPVISSLARNGSILEPETGEIYEAGLKTEWFDGRLGINAALFRIERDKVPIRDPSNGPGEFFSVSAGLQRADGLELEINGEPLPGWNISFAGILLDSEFIERDDPNFGNSPQEAADWQVGLYTSYELQAGLLKGFGLGAGLYAIDDRAVTESSPGTIEGYERVYLQTFYNGFKHLNLALQIRNVFDEKYIETLGFGGTRGYHFGSPLAVLFTVRYDFGN